MKRGKGATAYNTDAEAQADFAERLARERFDAEAKMHVETAHLLGVPLAVWMKRRTAFLEEYYARRDGVYGREAPSGPFVDGAQSWHAEYRALCVNGNQAILRREITAAALARDVLAGFQDVLSRQAVARWEKIAAGEPDLARPHVEPAEVEEPVAPVP